MSDRKEGTTDDRRPRTATPAEQSGLSLGVRKWTRWNRVRAKQSQKAGVGLKMAVETKPISRGVHRAKQSQFDGKAEEVGRDAQPTRSRSCETKPILPWAGGAVAGRNCAKQSQFPPPCRSGDQRSRGPGARNKANFGRRESCGKYFMGKGL